MLSRGKSPAADLIVLIVLDEAGTVGLVLLPAWAGEVPPGLHRPVLQPGRSPAPEVRVGSVEDHVEEVEGGREPDDDEDDQAPV